MCEERAEGSEGRERRVRSEEWMDAGRVEGRGEAARDGQTGKISGCDH